MIHDCLVVAILSIAALPPTTSPSNPSPAFGFSVEGIGDPDGARPSTDPKVLRALAKWVRAHRAGKIDMTEQRLKKTSPGVKAGVIAGADAGKTSRVTELDKLCRTVAETDDATTASALLEVAAAGLDPERTYPVSAAPLLVRRAGEARLDELKSAAAIEFVAHLALAEEAGAGAELAEQAAATLAVGRRRDEVYRPHIEKGFERESVALRLAAVEAAEHSELATLLKPLASLVAKESDDRVLTAALQACVKIVRVHRERVDQDRRRAVADAVIASVGVGGWRSDLSACELLMQVRSVSAVPVLIGVLERFAEDSEDSEVDEELRSGTLRHAAFDSLVSLTGARFPMEKPDEWREFWTKNRDSFEVVTAEQAKTAARAGDGKTSTGGFFGIPVRGSRVLFVIDTSGSMRETFHSDRRTGTSDLQASGGKSKMDIAKRELLKAVEGLAPDSSFNLVWFSHGAETWVKNLVPANKKNKLRFAKTVEKLEADGGTNLWQGLADGLDFESFSYAERYSVDVDELFILSDGVPTLGAVQDPAQILGLIAGKNVGGNLRVNTVYISSNPDAERRGRRNGGMGGAQFMKLIAKQNGGKFIGL